MGKKKVALKTHDIPASCPYSGMFDHAVTTTPSQFIKPIPVFNSWKDVVAWGYHVFPNDYFGMAIANSAALAQQLNLSPDTTAVDMVLRFALGLGELFFDLRQ